MTNAEFYREELLKMDHQIGIKAGMPEHCRNMTCDQCDLSADGGECLDGKLVKWILEEKE